MHIFFSYLVRVQLDCLRNGEIHPRCTNRHLHEVNLDSQQVQDCIDDSFEVRGDHTSDNKYLREDKEKAVKYGISVHPSMSINNFTYKGDLDGEDVFKAICTSFRAGEQPEYCKAGFDVKTSLVSIDSLELPENLGDHSRARKIHLIVGIGLVFICNGVCLIFFRRWQKRKY